MPQPPPPPGVGDAAGGPAGPLTPDAAEAVLADFRAWLLQVAAGPAPVPPEPCPDEGAPDLHTLLGQMTALRHEVNLQTRAARAQQEQHAEALALLGGALEALRSARPPEGARPPADDAVRPLLKTLVDLADSLGLARRELKRILESVLPSFDRLLATAQPVPLPELADPGTADEMLSRSLADLPFWYRWFYKVYGIPQELREDVADIRDVAENARTEYASHLEEHRAAEQRRAAEAVQAVGQVRRLLESIVAGYTMSLQRLERALQEHGLEPIPCVGRPFDPDEMEVLEAVADSGRPGGEVLEEVRRGYRWRGRAFRCAQVRVARPEP